MITFPAADAIPPEAKIDTAPYAMRYLVGGHIRTWDGPGEDVRAAVCVRQPDGTLARQIVGRMPMLDTKAALGALAAAKQAWAHGRGEWPTMTVGDRCERVTKFLRGMQKVREDVVRLMMWEIGKSRKDSESEFDRTVVYIRDTMEALRELDRSSARFTIAEGTIGQIRRSPLGVVLCMGPFNYPLNETFTTLIPALIMGNTVVSKLPKYGAMLNVPLFEAFATAFPPGAVNIIQGDGSEVIEPIMSSGDIDVLAFIGSSRVANILKKQHPRPHRLRCITGLEAKNPGVVLPDADLDETVKEVVSGALSFNGQRCTAIKITFVHEDIADEFVQRLAVAVDKLTAGMPWEPGAQLTPLPEEGKADALGELVADATARGARVINSDGGAALASFFRPAVVYPVTADMRLWSEEQFGPVVPVARFRDDGEIDTFMQDSPYGQQIALFGRDPARMAGLIDALVNQVCRININTQCRRGPDVFPFTGRKDSAEGTLSVHDALRAFSIRTACATDSSDANKALVTDIMEHHRSKWLSTDFLL
jgi:glyceraldehyde-3-phosphate dehydrogenase (NADP+)